VGAAVFENLEVAAGAPLLVLALVAVAGAVLLRWRARHLRGAALERALDLLDAWLILCALAGFAAVIWAAARRH
jgi:hypothetical protein